MDPPAALLSHVRLAVSTSIRSLSSLRATLCIRVPYIFSHTHSSHVPHSNTHVLPHIRTQQQQQQQQQTDIQYWDDTLAEEIQDIQAKVDRLPSITNQEKKGTALDKLKKKIRGAKGTKRSLKMEIRLVSDVNQRRKYESRLASLDQMLQTLVADCKAAESETQRGELFVGGGDGENGGGLTGEEGGDAMLRQASSLQDKTQDSLVNTKTMIAQSKEVGVATLEELERQRGVIENIDREADRIDDNLARAELLVRDITMHSFT
jgi:hypothetical protein